jgi:hypothetical protein
MDSTQTSIVAILGLVVSIFGSFLAAINHRRVRSNCCGHPIVMSVDVESTTPPLAGSAATMQPLAGSAATMQPLSIKIPDAQKKAQEVNLAVD